MTKPDLDLDAMEQTAREATPGPWKYHRGLLCSMPPQDDGTVRCQSSASGQVYAAADRALFPDTVVAMNTWTEADAAHIAAANPETVLALVAEVRELREVRELLALAQAERDNFKAANAANKGHKQRLLTERRELREQRRDLARALAEIDASHFGVAGTELELTWDWLGWTQDDDASQD